MGITEIKLMDFNLGSLGMLPGTAVYVFIGTTISSIADAATGKSTGNQTLILILFIVGSIFACIGVIWVSIVARKKINQQLEQIEEDKPINK